MKNTPGKAILLLADGTLFEGISFGSKGTAIGEVVFNTGITGYQEVLTDPSYFGQLVTFTYPEIGNTGINNEDNESENSVARGVITREVISKPSNWRCTSSFNDWLVNNNVIGITGIDTRALVRHLRNFGSINGLICSENDYSISDLLDTLKQSPSMEGLNLVDEVSTKKSYIWDKKISPEFDERIKNNISDPFKVIAIDFGIKKSILDRLKAHGCLVHVLPWKSSITDVLQHSPDGIFFSNGPGDPATVKEGIELARNLIKETNIPIFGICLGHQVLGIAIGGKTYKLPYGHRGLNHPCGIKGKIEITSQNHGFALDPHSFNGDSVEITHMNLNDKTVAGISIINKPIFGIQYHPEASPGPHDADHHFSRFVSLMEKRRIDVV